MFAGNRLSFFFVAILFISLQALAQNLQGMDETRQEKMSNMQMNAESMSQMMQQMQELMKTTTVMMQNTTTSLNHDHGFDIEMEAMVGEDELDRLYHENNPQATEPQSCKQSQINAVAQEIYSVMKSMQAMMDDKELMSNQTAREQMQQMQMHLLSLTSNFEAMVR